jgi:hypothetical protein
VSVNLRLTDKAVDAEHRALVHLPGVAVDHTTLCGWVWMRSESTDAPVTCGGCLAALGEARELVKATRRLRVPG